ncbi:glycerophosphoryl diester phosphodiesterase [Virgisporangium aliadipatigenens]|uniref:glycerophosphodiester phosphodiesterase n=1 Tax=Virgisporangium aliadipatigenens TaxID=741659 RepID=A0A8J3YV32_9ACTN|nr:glycerophosphodiester phosphodiesterase [Virgisporangium aliadipatigenens]GIJ51212.1 glycerophosphoryl diester phosphodiesterase [Virgisporangium aliadipatigenens]
MTALAAGGAAAGVTFAGDPASAGAPRPRRPLVIGHRGASGYRPEHTLASYELAARTGADFIEPDLVATKDRVLVARHENEISGTTDVATRAEFAGRRTTKTIDGVAISGWFTEDFTLAELKSLRAVERLPAVRQRNTLYDGRFQVPTLDEVLELRARLSRELDREIGVYPETKHPTYFRSIGLPLEEPLVERLRRHGLNRSDAPVFVQSFEFVNLRRLRTELKVRVPLVFLAGAGSPFNDPKTYAEYLSPAGLQELSRTIDGIGPEKGLVIPRNADGSLAAPTSLVRDAHAAGLLVHPYTFRPENQFLPANLRVGADPAAYGRAIDEIQVFLGTGIDGFFTDTPDIGVLARG